MLYIFINLYYTPHIHSLHHGKININKFELFINIIIIKDLYFVV